MVTLKHLNDAAPVAASVPATAVVNGLGAASGALTSLCPDQTDESRGKEQNGAQERKGNGGLELSALVAVDGVDVAPVEDAAAAASNEL